MSTKPVAMQADAAIEALSALSDDAVKAVNAAQKTVDNGEKTIGKVVHGAQVAVQHKKDEIEGAQHIIAQLSPKTATPAVELTAPAAGTTPTEPAASADDDATPAEPPVAPAPAEATAVLPVVEPVQAAPVAPAAGNVNNNVNQVNVGFGGFVAYTRTHFGAWAWVVAIVFLLIAFWIMDTAYPGFFPDKTGGLSHLVREFFAFLAIPLFWGFIGGLLVSFTGWYRAAHPVAARQPVAVVEAAPVAPPAPPAA